MAHRHRQVFALVAAAACLAASARAQPSQTPHDHDAQHRDVVARGARAIGFDQDRTVHHFVLDDHGGAIDVAVTEAGDQASLDAVRRHLEHVAVAFKNGDFAQPALTHGRPVPGTAEMARLRNRITYRYRLTPTGGRVQIVTRDAEARAAVHAFLSFQIEDHRTGDSGFAPNASPGPMTNGMGTGAMSGGHGGGMSEMRDVHELFLNHARITRTVTNLPNGIRTVTESADPRIAQLLKDHVTTSVARVETGIDPGLPMESPALRGIYQHHATIRTTVERTAHGIVVTQTSADPQAVAELQQHASEVTGFVDEGMAAMHKAMMKSGGGMMPHGHHGGMTGAVPKDKAKPQ